MRKSIMKLSSALLPLGIMVAMTACNDDDMPRPGFSDTELHATAVSNSGPAQLEVGDFVVTDFVVGTHELHVMYLPADAVDAGVTLENGTLRPNQDASLGRSTSEIRELALAISGEPQKSKIGEGETPNGIYSEM